LIYGLQLTFQKRVEARGIWQKLSLVFKGKKLYV